MNRKQTQAAAATLAALAVNGAVLHSAVELAGESWQSAEKTQNQKSTDKS